MPAAAHEDHPAAELLACDVDVQFACRHRGSRIVGLVRLPGPEVPDDDVAAAVLPHRDHALEIEVFDRMVLDMDGEPFHRRIQRRPVRDGPAHENAVNFEAKVIVQAAGPMTLYDETPLPVGAESGGCAGRLWGPAEITLGPIPSKLLAVPGHNPYFRTRPRLLHQPVRAAYGGIAKEAGSCPDRGPPLSPLRRREPTILPDPGESPGRAFPDPPAGGQGARSANAELLRELGAAHLGPA